MWGLSCLNSIHTLLPSLQALELPENREVREQLHATVGRLRQLPRVIAPPPPPGMSNGNGSNGNGQVPEGPAALLAMCRDLAMQVQVRGHCVMAGLGAGHTHTHTGQLLGAMQL